MQAVFPRASSAAGPLLPCKYYDTPCMLCVYRLLYDYIDYAGVPSTPVQITDVDYKYECTNFNVSLSWIQPYGNHQIDYYQLRIGGQSHVIVDDTSFIFNSLPYFENITIEVAVVNCAGVGAESTVVITRGVACKICVIRAWPAIQCGTLG